MFYSGATFEAHEAPAGLAGLQPGLEVEGLRYYLASPLAKLDTLLVLRSMQ